MTPKSRSVKTISSRLAVPVFPAVNFSGSNSLFSDQNLTLLSHSDGYPTVGAGAALTFGHAVLTMPARPTYKQRQIRHFRSCQNYLVLCTRKTVAAIKRN